MLKERVNILLVRAEVALTDLRDGTKKTAFVVARADDMALPVDEKIKKYFARLGYACKITDQTSRVASMDVMALWDWAGSQYNKRG